MSKIDSFLNNDEQHISIVLGPGCGKTTMSMILAGELSSSYNVVYLSYYISTREYAKHYFDDNGINARAETIQRFTNETMHAVYTPHENDLWIIDEAQDVGISDLQKRLNISAWSVKTISFADPLQVVDDKGNMSEMMELDESWDFTSAFVQTTSQAIDIRLCYAEEPDRVVQSRIK